MVAPTASEGIKAYRNSIHCFATFIIDYCLPDFKGTEVVEKIRRINPNQDVLFTSGFKESGFLIDMLKTGGARKFISKGRPSSSLRWKAPDKVVRESYVRSLAWLMWIKGVYQRKEIVIKPRR